MKILVLCTGNRCRSQMAQGILKNLRSDFIVCSAGVKAANQVHPLAIKVMAEIGIDISKNYPKNVDEYLNQEWDFVITVCQNANENCPIFSGKVKNRLHIGFDDPDLFVGSQEEIYKEFQRVRNQILEKMKDFINQYCK